MLLLRCGVPGLCFVARVPEQVINEWGFRKQYVGQAELLAGPLAVHCFRKELLGQSLLWFVDNQAALTAMIKGSSPVQDDSAMALIMALQLARHRVSCWFEYVDSNANPADPLSRDGYDDATVQHHVSTGRWRPVELEEEVDWLALVRLEQAVLVDQRWD